ncbi:MAG TPA: DUF1223 domain-containing protein [Candidatus Sulfotelmatobacter sp.]|nr:DUF1223 domain-containing protein [Candidatus Sulfotelmatobacter sp.]
MSRLLAARPTSFSILLWGLILPSLVTSSRGAEAGPPAGESAIGNPVLVELFTSEGCSSCPPADEFVKKLDTLQPVAGAQLIILSEHVDYWDHDGWKDPNSSHALTERQSAYVRALGLSTPYTPQIIVDGTNELKLADLQLVGKTFEKAASAPKIPVRITGVALSEGNPSLLKAHIDADGASSQHNADLYVAVALDHVESQVLRGENGGRNLTHVAVVQQIVKVSKLGKGRSFAQDVQLKVKPATILDQIRIVAFAQESGPGKLLGAALWKSVH